MDLTGASRRTASYSGSDGNSCVEVAVMPGSKEGSDHVIVVRDRLGTCYKFLAGS